MIHAARIRVDPEQFKAAYLQGYEWGQVICSPLRFDKNPSWAMYKRDTNVYWVDFATRDEGDAVQFVCEIENCSPYTALLKLNNYAYTEVTGDYRRVVPHEKIITWEPRGYNVHDQEYWEGRYQIPLEVLEEYDVEPAKILYLNDQFYAKGEHIYVYRFGAERCKVYMPYNEKNRKWLCVGNVVQGYDQLPLHGDLLVITKSLKDVMAFRTLGVPAIAPGSESVLLPYDFIYKLQKRFTRIVVCFDNDKAGIKGAQLYTDTYGFDQVYVPKEKDLTDWREKHRPSAAEQCAMIMG